MVGGGEWWCVVVGGGVVLSNSLYYGLPYFLSNRAFALLKPSAGSW